MTESKRSRRPCLEGAGLRLLEPEDGFSLVELVVAISVFAVIMTSAALFLGSTLTVTRNDKSRSVAANLASQEMDVIRGTAFAALPVGTTTATQTVDTVPYTITRTSIWISENSTGGSCSSPAGSVLAYLRETVSVTWADMKGTQPVVSQTVVTPPVGAFDPNSGHIAVVVRDRNAVTESGMTVSVTGPGVSQTLITTSDGCAFFAYLPANNYTVALGTAGYVDGQGSPTPSQTAAVQPAAITSIQFDYDRAATLSLTLTPSAGGTAITNIPLTIANTHFLPSGIKVTAAAAGPVMTVSNLFPYVDGYRPWAGGCADADPGVANSPILAVTPAGTTAATISMQSVQFSVKKAGVNQSGLTVVIVHAADALCASGATYTVGTTGASGVIVAVPFGAWTVQVSGKLPATSWPSLTVPAPASGTVTQLTVDIQ